MRKFLFSLHLVYSLCLFIGLMFLSFPLVLLASLLPGEANQRHTILIVLRGWAAMFSLFSGFWVKKKHSERVNRRRAHIYIANHGSYLDAIAVCLSIPQYFSALGKQEMVKVPVFGSIYKRIVVMIDRDSKESRAQSVDTLKQTISSGQSILIFPEGTMNKGTHVLNDFYDGAFRIAIETQTPIQPFVLLHNRIRLPRKNVLKGSPGWIIAYFLPPVEVEGMTLHDLDALKKIVHRQMADALTMGEND